MSTRITVKTSTVFVSVDRQTKIFRSVDEVPPEWRRRFDRANGGLKPQTILIADRKGREEILRSIQGQPSAIQTRWKASSSAKVPVFGGGIPVREPAPQAKVSRVPAIRFGRTLLIEAGFVGALAGLLYIAFFHS